MPDLMVTPRVCTVDIAGTLTRATKGVVTHKVHAMLDRGERWIVRRLAGLRDIDAAGVGELVDAYRLTVAAGGTLAVTEANTRVRRVLRASRVLVLLSYDERNLSAADTPVGRVRR